MARGNNPYRRRAAGRPSARVASPKGVEAVLALLGAGAVGAGWFEAAGAAVQVLPLLGLTLLAGGWGHFCRRRAGEEASPHAFLLWTVAIWMIYRLLQGLAPQAILLPAAFLAWLAAAYPLRAILPSLLAVLGMEASLTWIGQGQAPLQLGLDLAVFGGAVLGLLFFARSQVYRKRLRRAARRARREAVDRECAQDLGLSAEEPRPPYWGPSPGGTTLEGIHASFDLQLEMLRQALGLTTAAVLWPDAAGRELRLRGSASARRDLLPGPYPAGTGIAGALFRSGGELAMASVAASYSGLPYYEQGAGVGGIFALRIPEVPEGKPEQSVFPILCVDRTGRAEWTERERLLLKLAARKLALEVASGRRLESSDRERHAMQGVFLAMQELNGVLGLEAVYEAALKAVRVLVQADLAAISLLEDDQHRVVHAEGEEAEGLIDLAFSRDEGLVGQVLKRNQALPAGGTYPGAAPVFSREQRLADFSSLLILPLRKEEGKPIGALTLAAREGGAFSAARRPILELIATQVAIKIDLAQAHERINSMATTDGLTGLANHRAFQNNFEIMLARAERRHTPLCLVLCDLDHFKRLNDTHGHPFGDQVLQAVAGILGGAVRRGDLAARYGGEEFALLLEDADRSQGRQIAERVRQKVEALALGRERVSPTMSFGLAIYPQDGTEKSLLISRADQALYQSKNQGRNCITLWAEPAGPGTPDPAGAPWAAAPPPLAKGTEIGDKEK